MNIKILYVAVLFIKLLLVHVYSIGVVKVNPLFDVISSVPVGRIFIISELCEKSGWLLIESNGNIDILNFFIYLIF